MLLQCAKAAVKGDKRAMEVMSEYTCASAKHPIRLGSPPSPRAGSVNEGRYFHSPVASDHE